MKLVFDSSTECESLVTVIDINKEGLQQLLDRMKLTRSLINGSAFYTGVLLSTNKMDTQAHLHHMTYEASGVAAHECSWDSDFDPHADGELRMSMERMMVSRRHVWWEFWVKHVDGSYETPWIFDEAIEDLIENPRDVWYGERIQDEIDWEKKKLEKETG